MFLFEEVGIRVMRIKAAGDASGLTFEGNTDLGRIPVGGTTPFQLRIGIDAGWSSVDAQKGLPEVQWRVIEGGAVRVLSSRVLCDSTTDVGSQKRASAIARLAVKPNFLGRGQCRVHASVSGLELPLYVRWEAHAPVRFERSVLVLAPKANEGIQGSLTVWPEAAFEVVSAKSSIGAEALTASLMPNADGRGYTLIVNGPRSWLEPGIGTIDLRVRRTGTGEELLVPLRVVAGFREENK